MMFSQPAPPSVPSAAMSPQTTPDQVRATQHGVGFMSRRAFSFKAKWAASGRGTTPLRSAARRSAVQPRNNSFGNSSDCFRSRSSLSRGQGTAVALATLKPSPFQPPSFIQIKKARADADGELEGIIAEAQDLLAALQKRREAKGVKP